MRNRITLMMLPLLAVVIILTYSVAVSAETTAPVTVSAEPTRPPTATIIPVAYLNTVTGPLFFTSPLKPPYILTNTSHNASISPAADYAPRPNLGNDKHIVYSPIDGKVTLRSRWQTANSMGIGNYGNNIIVVGEKYKVLIAHCSDKEWAFVKDSTQVIAGTPLCWMGSTGWTSPPGAAHVHLEVWKDGKRIDPRSVMGVPNTAIYDKSKTTTQSLVVVQDNRENKTTLSQMPDVTKIETALLKEIPDLKARMSVATQTAQSWGASAWDGTLKIILMDAVLVNGQRVVAWVADFDRIEIDPVMATQTASIEEVLAHELGHIRDLYRDGGPSQDIEAGAERYKSLFRNLVSSTVKDPVALIRQYFPQAQWSNAEKVMKCESGGVASKVGDDYPINGLHVPSYGLFQIRAFSSRAKAAGLTDMAFRAKLLEAEYNVQYAVKLWKQVSQKWSPTWSCATKLGIK